MAAGGLRPDRAGRLRGVTVGLLVLLALALAPVILTRNLESACVNDEWPHFSACPRYDLAPAEQALQLRARAVVNPGDVTNYLALALLTAVPGAVEPLDPGAVLDTATQLGGNDRNLQRVMASRELAQSDWTAAVRWLARLVQSHRDPVAAQVMASLMLQPDAHQAVLTAVTTDSKWVGPVLGALGAAKVPVVQAMPLVVSALDQGLIRPEQGLDMVRQLKAAGQWQDAHALWLRLLGRPSPLLYNGGFETGFERGGFDWEVPSDMAARSGVDVQQPVIAGANGHVLELNFNGRPLMLPVLAQPLVLWPGAYTLVGRYKTLNLRAGEGLGWVLNCLPAGGELARTPALADSGRKWQSFAADLVVPDGCAAVTLQLRTTLASDALAGLRGQIWFDDLQLATRLAVKQ